MVKIRWCQDDGALQIQKIIGQKFDYEIIFPDSAALLEHLLSRGLIDKTIKESDLTESMLLETLSVQEFTEWCLRCEMLEEFDTR